jgi:hypothetical protein
LMAINWRRLSEVEMTEKTGRDPIVIRKAMPDDVPGIAAVLSEAL